jgi:hypothetical protein
MAIESLLGCAVAGEETISISIVTPSSAPEWLQKSWKSAKHLGLDRLLMAEINSIEDRR